MSKLSRARRQTKERFNNINIWSHRFHMPENRWDEIKMLFGNEIDFDTKGVREGMSLEEMNEWMRDNHSCGNECGYDEDD